jgi:hypothetical protein
MRLFALGAVAMSEASVVSSASGGLFSKWQPQYAALGIATFPVAEDAVGKRPAVRGYLKVGLGLSSGLAARFSNNNAFGFALGPRDGITVLDVDTPDERILSRALAKHGASPLIVRSGSGNWCCAPLLSKSLRREREPASRLPL